MKQNACQILGSTCTAVSQKALSNRHKTGGAEAHWFMAAVEPDIKPHHEGMNVVIPSHSQLKWSIDNEVILRCLVDIKSQ